MPDAARLYTIAMSIICLPGETNAAFRDFVGQIR